MEVGYAGNGEAGVRCGVLGTSCWVKDTKEEKRDCDRVHSSSEHSHRPRARNPKAQRTLRDTEEPPRESKNLSTFVVAEGIVRSFGG